MASRARGGSSAPTSTRRPNTANIHAPCSTSGTISSRTGPSESLADLRFLASLAFLLDRVLSLSLSVAGRGEEEETKNAVPMASAASAEQTRTVRLFSETKPWRRSKADGDGDGDEAGIRASAGAIGRNDEEDKRTDAEN